MDDGYTGECQILDAGGSTTQTWIGDEFVVTVCDAQGGVGSVRMSALEFERFRWQGAHLYLRKHESRAAA